MHKLKTICFFIVMSHLSCGTSFWLFWASRFSCFLIGKLSSAEGFLRLARIVFDPKETHGSGGDILSFGKKRTTCCATASRTPLFLCLGGWIELSWHSPCTFIPINGVSLVSAHSFIRILFYLFGIYNFILLKRL